MNVCLLYGFFVVVTKEMRKLSKRRVDLHLLIKKKNATMLLEVWESVGEMCFLGLLFRKIVRINAVENIDSMTQLLIFKL